jgi:hypothetical protein
MRSDCTDSRADAAACAQGDVSALVPGGLRMGTPALTTRGFDEAAFEKVRPRHAVHPRRKAQRLTPAPARLPSLWTAPCRSR